MLFQTIKEVDLIDFEEEPSQNEVVYQQNLTQESCDYYYNDFEEDLTESISLISNQKFKQLNSFIQHSKIELEKQSQTLNEPAVAEFADLNNQNFVQSHDLPQKLNQGLTIHYKSKNEEYKNY
ncbi:UNKNOWN [Stylonychia lemnae]|uniref:Uncharacterized protein n=1 Tax=Stylonychia lemnae TaxID=5949 RepID=A0A078AYY2_STYLE|nr:UNKNOWN [Stylonychia lemnae]|eukprot:CDW86392.1 UNKNOWN [Stylonychia lemnae]